MKTIEERAIEYCKNQWDAPIEGKQECRNECEIYGKRFCEKKEQ